jgi:hypothetical protein
MSRCLLESATQYGVFISGCVTTIDATVVRGTQPFADQTAGFGIYVDDNPQFRVRANTTIKGSLVDGNRTVGVLVQGSDVTIEATVVRNTQPQASDQVAGRGIEVQNDPGTGARTKATIRASIVEDNRDIGLIVNGSDATIEATVVRGTQLQMSDRRFGSGVVVQTDASTQAQASATVDACVIAHNRSGGLVVVGADASITGTIVDDTLQQASDGTLGDAIIVSRNMRAPGVATTATISGCAIGDSTRAGVSNFGAQVSIDGTSLNCNVIDLDGEPNGGQGYSFDLSGGGDACGCDGGTSQCQVLSSGLAPPQPIGP